jgi:3-oxoacyl-[acyl-carrier protein] reductase
MELELAGQVAVVADGASGIGLACARGLAREGCHVALMDVSAGVEDTAATFLEEFRTSSLGLRVDVSDHEVVQDAVRQTEATLGPIYHLVTVARPKR